MVSTLPATPEAFIDHWTRAEANERANSQVFLLGLAHLLGVPAPSNSHAYGYSFEYPVKVPGGSSTNFIDLYWRGHFVFESKQFAVRRVVSVDVIRETTVKPWKNERINIWRAVTIRKPNPTRLDSHRTSLHCFTA